MRLFQAAAAAFALASVVSAQTVYYVDAVGGSDLSPGTTRTTAFKSITFANTFLTDDDTLIVLPGTYSTSTTGEQFPIQFGATQSQLRVKIIADGGPNVTILDGEQQATGAGIPLLRFRALAEGAVLRGLQITNTGSANYWSMGIRLGSTSGASFAAKDVEISGCIFRNVYRGIVIFGSEPGTPPQTTGCMIHDNLFENAAHRAIAVWGDGVNYVDNNTFVNGGYEGVYVDSLNTQGGSNARVRNNIVVGCSSVGNLGGIAVGTTNAANNPVIISNTAFGNGGGDFVGFTAGASNVVADPMFVGANDYHLQLGSTAIQTGDPITLGRERVDLDGMARAHDSDGDGVAGVDRGAYQYTQYSMTTTGIWAPGGVLTFTFTAPSAGGSVLFFATGGGSFLLSPFGMFAFDPSSLLVATLAGAAPGSTPITVPNNPALLGNRLIVQGGYVGPAGPIHVLHAVDRWF